MAFLYDKTGKLNIVVSDETEQRFRQAIADIKGFKKGNISEAAEEAFDLWFTNNYRPRSRKTEITGSWTVHHRSSFCHDVIGFFSFLKRPRLFHHYRLGICTSQLPVLSRRRHRSILINSYYCVNFRNLGGH